MPLVALHGQPAKDPLEVLRRVGGREIAAIAGAILAARAEKVPVILDGYVATAAAAVLHATRTPAALDHCLLGHVSTEPASWPRCRRSSATSRCSTSGWGSARAWVQHSRQASSKRRLC